MLLRCATLVYVTLILNSGHVISRINENTDLDFWTNALCASNDVNFNIYGIFEKQTDHSADVSGKLIQLLNQKCSPVIILNSYFINNTQKEEDAEVETSLHEGIIAETVKKTGIECQRMRRNNLSPRKIWQLNVILTENEDSALKIFKTKFSPRWKSNDYFVIIIVNAEKSDEIRTNIAETVLKLFWTQHNILRTLLLFPSSVNVFVYEPFAANNNSDINRTRNFPVSSSDALADILFNISEKRLLNFNGATMRVRRDFLPRVKINSKDGQPILSDDVDKLEYFHDILMYTITKHMNFVPNMVGRFQGANFDVFKATYDFNFEPVAVMAFEDQEMLELVLPVMMQSVCTAVAKGAVIPKSLQLFRCFKTEVWLCILISMITIIITIRLLLKQSHRKSMDAGRLNQLRSNKMQDSNKTEDLSKIIVNSFLLMIGAPVPIAKRLLDILSVRIILTGVLLANVTIMGTFASSLYRSFTVVFHYKSIQDAKDLDESGLWYVHNRDYTMYPFGKDDADPSPHVIRMRNKVKRINKTDEEMFNLVLEGKIATRVALSDDKSVIFPKYPTAEERAGIYILTPCTRRYFSSYSVMKESPYYDRFNEIMYALNQAGIPRLWMNRVHTHSMNVGTKKRKRKDSASRQSPSPFNVEDLQSAFYILAIGLSMASIIFVAEICW